MYVPLNFFIIGQIQDSMPDVRPLFQAEYRISCPSLLYCTVAGVCATDNYRDELLGHLLAGNYICAILICIIQRRGGTLTLIFIFQLGDTLFCIAHGKVVWKTSCLKEKKN